MRVMGLDVGTKTIGIALSDEIRMIGHPLETLQRQGLSRDVSRLAALVSEHCVTEVVVGIPLLLSGQSGDRAKDARTLVSALCAEVMPLVVHEWDERFSTAAVERVLIQGKVSRKRRKKVIDKQAAAYILQGWLDAQAVAK